MRVALFYHSLVSDWNHGNAHFLRGIVTELMARGHRVEVFEPAGGWSRSNLVSEYGDAPVAEFHSVYPELHSREYTPETFDPDRELAGVDLVIVHEWSKHALVERIGQHRANSGGAYRLLFHDTHHRAVTDPDSMAAYRLENYDGVLAFGDALRRIYEQRGWGRRVWTWHEAADTRVFRPFPEREKSGDLVWIGNWGDGERAQELSEFLLEPVRQLGLRAQVYGVRYPQEALEALSGAGIDYGGWLPNYRVPESFSRYRVTVHVPRRPYARALAGIPTIRPFEAMACRIPLVMAPWEDREELFRPGDYLPAANGEEMKRHLRAVMNDPAMAQAMAEQGYRTVVERHTCAHRVTELMNICEEIAPLREDPVATGTSRK